MKKYLLILVGLVCLLLAACSNNEESASQNNKDNKQEEQQQEEKADFPEAATDAQSIVKGSPGSLIKSGSGKQSINPDDILKEIPSSADAETAYNGLVSMLHADYSEVHAAYEDYNPEFASLTSEEEKIDEENVVILLDSSGSMAGQVSGGTKMDLAKDALKRFSSNLPEDANILLRAYGHKGSNDDSDKELSCSSNEVFYDLDTYDENTFNEALGQFKPTGWTPLGDAISSVQSDLKGKTGERVKNKVYIVSDGVETCDGDPVSEAEKLHHSDLEVTVNIIGFNVDTEGRRQLEDAAEAGGGVYKTVNSKVELNNTLNQLLNDAHKSIQADLASAKADIAVNKEHLQKNKEVDEIRATFNDIVQTEEDLLYKAAQELYFEEKITKEEVELLKEKITQRSDTLLDYSEKKHDELSESIKVEKEKMFDKIDEKTAS
ncbi:VWA domain-containing protein [Alkalihalobacillus sp. CinArs1]|uniref:VWA domain-containing protein n=1 Tax=Alkalihalobacillus sp. CinArs1 TaxID=2995314 RepID=UPI0022DD7B6A|nr:VWA domain-containing protein [Alkalihalobacillus sp. CinArs1]